MPKEELYLIPELDVRVSRTWINYIQWVRENVSDGQICAKTVGGEPVKLVDELTFREIRFDKGEVAKSQVKWKRPEKSVEK